MSDVEKRLIDANVILRYLLQDEASLFARSSEFLERVKTGAAHAVILDSVLAECVYVLLKVYHVDRPAIADNLRALLAYKGFGQPDREDLLAALELFGRTHLSIVDCLLWAKSQATQTPLFTFDEELARKSQPRT